MTGGGVWDDMPTPPWPADGELPPPGDAAFDALLNRAPLPGDAATGLHRLAGAFGELYAAPPAAPPAAEQQAMTAFRAAVGRPATARPAPARRASAPPAGTRPAPGPRAGTQPVPAVPAETRPRPAGPGRRRAHRPRLTARLAAAGAAVAVSLGGAAAAAAYTGALPYVLHRLTHHPASPAATAPGSPAQPTTESRSATPGTGPGLCAAYQHALAVGSPSAQRKAFRKIAAAAGGAGNVTSYCAGVVEPQPTPDGQHTHPAHPAHPTHPPHPTHPAHPPHPSHSPK